MKKKRNLYSRSKNWTYENERQLIEELFNQRINFFILAVSLIITGYATTKDLGDRILILSLGLVIITILGLSLYRACHKLHIHLYIARKTIGHPEKLANKAASLHRWPLSSSVNKLTGITLPVLCVSLLFFTLIIQLDKAGYLIPHPINKPLSYPTDWLPHDYYLQYTRPLKPLPQHSSPHQYYSEYVLL